MMGEAAKTMADDDSQKMLHLLDVIASTTQRLESEVGALKASVDRIDAKVDALTTELRTGLDRVERLTGFDRVERRLGHIETRVEGVEDRVTALEARPSAADES
jgi:phage shock protein A